MRPHFGAMRRPAAIALAVALLSGPVAAQSITIDGSLSAARTLVGPNYTISADLGKQVGGNLFHSFGKFGLVTNESATFTNTIQPNTVSNVIGRVTGGSPSAIDGAIKTDTNTLRGANLYLINPYGIVFGPNATVNVSGSFHASTADYLKLSDGARFQATNPSGSTLSAAAPAAFGFLNVAPPRITVNGSQLGVTAAGATLGVVGGPVTIENGAKISAPAGTIHVASAAGAGEVPVDPTSAQGLTVTNFGAVGITGNSTLEVSDPTNLGSGGSVFIRAGTLAIDASEVNGDNYGAGPGGRLELAGDNSITLTGGAFVHSLAQSTGSGAAVSLTTAPGGSLSIDQGFVETGTGGTGDSGSLSVVAGQLSIGPVTGQGGGSGGIIASLGLSGSSGRVGDITIGVAGLMSIDGTGATEFTGIAAQPLSGSSATGGGITVAAGQLTLTSGGEIFTTAANISVTVNGALDINGGNITTGILSQALAGSTAAAGSVTVQAGSLTILGAGLISSDTFGSGNARGVSVTVDGTLKIDGAGAAPNSRAGIFSDSEVSAKGDAGKVRVSAGSLSIADNGEISSGAFGPGAAGEVAVSVSGTLTIDASQANANGGPTGILSQANTGSTGNAGNVTVNAGDLSILNNGEISGGTFGPGAAGDVAVRVANQLTIDGSQANANGGPTGILSQANSGSTGNAGTVTVNTGDLTLVDNGQISGNTFGAGHGGAISVDVTGTLIIDGTSANTSIATGILSDSQLGSTGNAGNVTVSAGDLSIRNNGEISSSTFGPKSAGDVVVRVANQLTIDASQARNLSSSAAGIFSQTNSGSTGDAGTVTVSAGSLSIVNNGTISGNTSGAGKAGEVRVDVTGVLTIDGTLANTAFATGILSDSQTGGTGNAGSVTVNAGDLSILNNGEISSGTFGPGSAGNVTVRVANRLTIDDSQGDPRNIATGIFSQANSGSTGNAGTVTVNTGDLTLVDNGQISGNTFGAGHGGAISVAAAGTLTIDGTSANTAFATGIVADAEAGSTGNAGNVAVSAGGLSIRNNGEISSSTFGPGSAGNVTVGVANQLTIDDSQGDPRNIATGIFSQANSGSTGAASNVKVSAGDLSVDNNGEISSDTFGPGQGGNVLVSVDRTLAVAGGSIIADTEAGGSGNAGSVTVSAGTLSITSNGEISSSTFGLGSAGGVTVSVAKGLTIDASQANPKNGATGIFSQANQGSAGNAGGVTVTAGTLSITSNGEISSSTFGPGAAGDVTVSVAKELTIDASQGNPNTSATGIFSQANSGSAGAAGTVAVSAGDLSIDNNGAISSITFGTGKGGEVSIDVTGALTIDGTSANTNFATGIVADAEAGSSGNAGNVSVTAGSLSILANGEISSEALGPNGGLAASTGNAGDVTVKVAGLLSIDQSGATISTGTGAGTVGHAGRVTVDAGSLSLVDNGQIASITSGAGHGGEVGVEVTGTLKIDGTSADTRFATGILADAEAGSSGKAGNVSVTAGSLTILANGEISSSALGPNTSSGAPASTGSAGNVTVSVAGLLSIEGSGGPAGITTSTGSGTSGAAGIVTVNAGSLSILGQGQIASTSAGSGVGGDVRVTARGVDIFDGGSISTEGTAASGGNITLSVSDLLYLRQGEITTSSGGPGVNSNGGNIAIDPSIVVLADHSTVKADAFGGNGGNIDIHPNVYISSADSTVHASSQQRSSGTIAISGQVVGLNGALIVLSSELRGAAAILRTSCAARFRAPRSSFVEGGRGGLPQDPDMALPALYLAPRAVAAGGTRAARPPAFGIPRHTAIRVTMRCG